MLIAKGSRVVVELSTGRRLRGSGALLHDPAGKDWPICSALVAPVTKTRRPVSDREAARYLGGGYDPELAWLTLPPRALGEWDRVGAAVAIDYTRIGAHADNYTHEFRGDRATVYRRGRLLRIELGKGCTWNWRGFVNP